jgi:hypothetical protein
MRIDSSIQEHPPPAPFQCSKKQFAELRTTHCATPLPLLIASMKMTPSNAQCRCGAVGTVPQSRAAAEATDREVWADS